MKNAELVFVVFVAFVIIVAAAGAAFLLAPMLKFTDIIHPSDELPPLNFSVPVTSGETGLKTFTSWNEVTNFLEATSRPQFYGRVYEDAIPLTLTATAPSASSKSSTGTPVAGVDYSTTNVQVAGVDEADILKNDGKYLYTITDGKIAILQGYPASDAKLLSIINDSAFDNLFINGDLLIALGNSDFNWEPIVTRFKEEFYNASNNSVSNGNVSNGNAANGNTSRSSGNNQLAWARVPLRNVESYPYYPSAFVKVYNVSNRSNPQLLKTIDSQGTYVASRMIGNKVYVVFSEYATQELPIPLYAINGKFREVQPTEINYIDEPFERFSFTTLLGFDTSDLNKEETRKVVLGGGGENVYASVDNAFITYTHYNYYYPRWLAYEAALDNETLPNQTLSLEITSKINAIETMNISAWRKDNLKINVVNAYLDSLGNSGDSKPSLLREKIYRFEQQINEQNGRQPETTVVHKFALGDSISYIGKGEVLGHVLNQFSMDEYNNYFRIATTINQVSQSADNNAQVTNNVYVLDSNLKTIGKLEDLARGEKIYSARFMGNRAYLVTFKKVDPLFVIGLENPANPIVLGKLKIPGYSDYLHPYDETHLIGLGKDAIPSETGDFAWYQGVKLSLFDVSNVSNPVELANYSIGDRGTDSYALNDHKAFLFDKQRNLLVLPITLYQINRERNPSPVANTYGEAVFQGAYVFNVSLDNGFTLRGRVSHADNDSFTKSGDYYYGYGTNVMRSAYIGNYLYTVSQSLVKANNLTDLTEVAYVKLPFQVPIMYNDYGYVK